MTKYDETQFMVMKLLSTFLTTAAFYLAIYFIFLLFLMYIIGISPLTLQSILGKKAVYFVLIVAGCKSWDTIFGKKSRQKNDEQQDNQ